MAGDESGSYMHFLALLPDLGAEINAIAQEILRSGHTIYPLMGAVTERQFAEACDPAHGFDALIVCSHGSPNGVLLKPAVGVGEDDVWLSPHALVAGLLAAGTFKLLVLATCEGRGLAEEAYWRAGVTTVYSDGDLSRFDAYTLAGTFLRRLRTGTLDDALGIADALGMHWYPARLSNGQREIADALQEAVSMLARRMDGIEGRTDRRMDGIEGRMDGIEGKLDTLNFNAMIMTPARRLLWVLGAVMFAAPFVVSVLYNLYLHGQNLALAGGALIISLALSLGLLLAGFGRLPT